MQRDDAPGVIRVVAMRELRDHVRSARFLALCVLALVLLPLSAFVNAQRYRAHAAHATALRAEQQRTMALPITESGAYESRYGWRSGRVISDPALRAIRSPTPFAALATGAESAIPLFWQFSTEGLEPGPSVETEHSARMDAVFVVQMVLGLLALLLVFDSVSGERESGVLRLLLSMPVRRGDLLLGKALGALLTLALPLVLGLTASLVVLERAGLSLLHGEDSLRLVMFLGASTLYLGEMVAFGLAVSAVTRRARTSWVVLLLVWIVVVLVTPPAAEMIASAVEHTTTQFDVRQAKTDAILQIERERSRKISDAWLRAVGSDSVPGAELPPDMLDAYSRVVVPVDQEMMRKKRAAIRALDESHRRSVERQQRIARYIGRISPAAVYAAIAGRLAGTDDAAAERWTEQVEAHQARLETATFDRSYGVELFPRRLNYLRITWWPELRDPERSPPDYDDLPAFAFRKEPLSRALEGALPDFLILSAGAAIAICAALIAFSRTDLQ